MTYDHASQILLMVGFREESQNVKDACAMAVTALEKEIPMKPERYGNPNGMRGLTWWHVCSRCKSQVIQGEPRCRKCGQVIQWNDA